MENNSLRDDIVKIVAKKITPPIIGVDHNALVIDCGNGRIRLMALSDLEDLEEIERLKEEYREEFLTETGEKFI